MSSSIESSYTHPTTTAADAIDFNAPDLTRHPPRSPHARLGGYVHLPRLIDKARAFAAGTIGDFHYPCPFDRHFFEYAGLTAEAFLSQVKAGKSDSELLAYVSANAQPKRHLADITVWSTWLEQLTPSNPDARALFNEVHRKNAAHREDIVTWFDWLELDDFVTFGGRP